jgi:ABC-type multidrug transport system ATPase subunit
MGNAKTTFRGYCQQTDTHLPQATVRETILSSAHLRQSEFVPMEEIQAQCVLLFCIAPSTVPTDII